MSTVGQSKLDAATIGFRVIYKDGFEAAKPFHEPFCQMVPSNGSAEDYLIPGGVPTLREWVGERHYKNLKAYDYKLNNKKFENTIEVPREKVEDDNATGLGFYDGQVRQLGARARTFPSKMLASLLHEGFTELCYDGVPFFSDSHPIKSGTQSNKTTAALDANAFEDAMAALLSMKDYQGEPVDPIGMGGELYLVVPPALRATAQGILEKELVATSDGGSESNANYKAAKLVVSPYLTSDTEWFLLVGGNYKPFIQQNRTSPEFQALTAADSDHVIKNDTYLWGLRWRMNLGYGVYLLAYGSTGAG